MSHARKLPNGTSGHTATGQTDIREWSLTTSQEDTHKYPAGSVVIPAHNEEAAIGRCLRALLGEAVHGEFETLVVCNGCSDDTAVRARDAAVDLGVRVTVLELPEAGKPAALRAGEAHAPTLPRIYLDADAVCSTFSARALLTDLNRPGVELAVPHRVLALDAVSPLARWYHTAWSRLDWVTEQLSGRGVYALSVRGRERFGAIPELVADDAYVTSRVPRSAARIVPSAPVTIFPPRRLRDVVRVRTRVFIGNHQIADTTPAEGRAHRMLRRATHPATWPGLAIYLPVTVLAKFLARRSLRRGSTPDWGQAPRGEPTT